MTTELANDAAVDDWGRSAADAMDAADSFDDFDAGDVDAEAIGSRIAVDKIGKYHFEIADAKPRPEKVDPATGKDRRPNILLTCRVCQSVPGQSPEGSIYFHELLLGGPGGKPQERWSKEATANFLYGVGLLIKRGDAIIDPETGSSKIASNTLATRLKSIQFIGDIKLEKSDDPKYADKYRLNFGRGAFRLDDPAVANVPINRGASAVAPPYPAGPLVAGDEGPGVSGAVNGNGPHGAASGATSAAPAASPPATKGPAAANAPAPVAAGTGDDDFSDL